MFFNKKEINPYPVSDTVRFRNVDKTLTLTVRTGASSVVLGIKKAQERFKTLNDQSPETERAAAAKEFAEAMFGGEQAERLIQFYDNDSLAVVNACGMYFSNRLTKLITKAQKK